MPDSQKLLGLRIKEVRSRKKISQATLAEKVGIDPKHLSRIEVGKSSPSLKTLEKISSELGVEIRDLFEFQHLSPSQEDLMQGIQAILGRATREDLSRYLKLMRSLNQ